MRYRTRSGEPPDGGFSEIVFGNFGADGRVPVCANSGTWSLNVTFPALFRVSMNSPGRERVRSWSRESDVDPETGRVDVVRPPAADGPVPSNSASASRCADSSELSVRSKRNERSDVYVAMSAATSPTVASASTPRTRRARSDRWRIYAFLASSM